MTAGTPVRSLWSTHVPSSARDDHTLHMTYAFTRLCRLGKQCVLPWGQGYLALLSYEKVSDLAVDRTGTE